MPLKWERGKNLYVHSYFGRLKAGPNTLIRQLISLADNQIKVFAAGKKIDLAGVELDEHAISEAKKAFLNPRSHAEELLLAHPQSHREQKKLKQIAEQIRETAQLPDTTGSMALYHPLAIMWFLPSPGPEAAELPPWSEFAFVEAGDPEDLELDIVFDC
jgi:hypothetical protein